MYIIHIEADPAGRLLVRRAVERIGRHVDVIAVDTLRSALCVMSSTRVACVVTELALRDSCGPEILEGVQRGQPGVPVVVLASGDSKARAGAVVRFGTAEYVCKGSASPDTVSVAIRDALGRAVLADIPGSDAIAEGPAVTRFGGADFITSAKSMRRALGLVESAAESDVPVLLEGETGTGKEILARALHARSARRHSSFAVQNCGAVSEQLLESELFGHVRGAYTGAERDRSGLFLEAGDGTVFLDEIGEASPTVQARLLRVLQHREVKPVGSDRVHCVGARVVAATNRPLADEVRAGRFRPDLYYRLTVFPIRVPPLRQRAADIPSLLRHFLARLGARERKGGLTVSREAIDVLSAYHWPGNVRELEHEVHRLVLTLGANARIEPRDLAARIRGQVPSAGDEPLDEMMACVELALIRQRLDRFTTKADAARSLGITREGLYAKLKRLGASGTTPA